MKTPDWDRLGTCYGSASEIPELLRALEPDPASPVWSALWGELYHQGDTYEASPHVLPYLAEAAAGWNTLGRVQPIALAGAIAAAPQTKLAGFEEALADLRVIALETVAAPGIDRIERVYLIQSLMAFEGDRVWGRSLDCLSDGGADVSCPKCGSDFSFEIPGGTNPCAPEEMPEPGRRLRGYALEAGDAELARNLCELFGTVECPACGEVCSTPKAIAAMCRSY